MNKQEFETVKAELARNILNSYDEELIESMRRCYENSIERRQNAPCQYTLDEVKSRLRSIETDAITGQGLTTEEVLSATEHWL